MTNETKKVSYIPLIATSLAMFIIVVDSTMMNVALPTIVKEFNSSMSVLQAGVSLYSLVIAALILTGAKLGDTYGFRRMFRVGLVIYVVGTLLATFSWSAASLIVGWSFIEGLGAALMVPLTYTIIATNYDGRMRAVGFGMLAGVTAAAAAVGPILGGFLTEYLSWRVGFGGEAVIAIIVLAMTPKLVESRPAAGRAIDWMGTALSATGLALIALGAILAGQYGMWNARRPFVIGDIELAPFGLSVVPFIIAIGIGFGIAFLHHEARQNAAGKPSLIRVSLLGNGRFVAGFSSDAVMAIVLAGIMFVLPILLQNAFGLSPMEAGLQILSLSAATLVFSILTPRFAERFGPKRTAIIGLIVAIAGQLFYWDALADETITGTTLILPGILTGMGVGIILAQITDITLSAVTQEESAEASGVQQSIQELGRAFGPAIVGSMFLIGFYGGITDAVLRGENISVTQKERDQLVVVIEDELGSIDDADKDRLAKQLPAQEVDKINSATANAMIESARDSLIFSALLTLAALGIATMLPGDSPKRGRRQQAVEQHLHDEQLI